MYIIFITFESTFLFYNLFLKQSSNIVAYNVLRYMQVVADITKIGLPQFLSFDIEINDINIQIITNKINIIVIFYDFDYDYYDYNYY